ncbi:hypothetical protein AC579_1080 [Pseudocercospora musae]|uniref:Ribosome quality control complex subunit 2 n=1 Tax=Pseudocercospora musae TaxID=113226 RepID=A0A139I0S8_9PEZI|nr:hypothetical protein AC579_1080 [Pseudocercospora musae]
MKQRFSSLDVKCIAHELSNSLTTLRLANVYDLSTRIFLLKFQKPEHREQLIVDSGFRCHLTKFARATAAAPSPFVARLRRFLKTRRCTAVKQIGTDRVIELQFSDGAYRLFLEFYAGGNIVLTDNELTILALLRSVSEGAEHEQYRQGLKYNLSLRQNHEGVPDLTKQWLKESLQRTVEKQQSDAQKPGKKTKKKAGDALRKALAVTTTQFPPVLLDHALHVSDVDRELQPEQVLEGDELLERVLHALKQAESVVAEITSQPVAKGYILGKRKQDSKQEDAEGGQDENKNVMYEDFHPFKPAQLAKDQSYVFLEHDGFNAAVDEFFSSIEGQKLESRLQEREDNARQRIEHARKEQEQRIEGLQQIQEIHVRKAQAIEANVERVEEATAAVNGLVAQGMDWADIGSLIENEQARHNPVAELIKLPLKLHENTITLLLSEMGQDADEDMEVTDSEPSDSDEEDAQTTPAPTQDQRLTIDIDLAASAWSNARQYYDQKRTAASKQERTEAASKKALKSAEQNVMAKLKKDLKQEKDILRPVRKQFWFEKFIYFISSDGYLVLAGKDDQQNEMMYRRHLKKGDVYVHADLNGASSVVIKNNPHTPSAPIPPSTLAQAGDLVVCTSSAWDSKAVMSAWWVNAEQVSKTADTGEYLAVGSFIIRGKKNFLPPARLLLGFGIMFQISEESKARHVKHRLLRQDSYQATPDLTDAETIAESSAAGGPSDDGSDDDFPDAAPAPRIEDEDDEFADVQQVQDEISSDESPEEQRERTYGTHDYHDEDEDHSRSQRNPLQSSALNAHDDDDHQNEDGDDEKDEEIGSVEGSTNGSELGREDTESTVTPGTADPTEDGQEEQPATSQPLSNKERKALAKFEKDRKPQPSQKAKAKQIKALVRGKRGKAKKLAEKYADQDEEDREIAMRLLGSRKAEEKREAEAAAKAAKTETAEETRARRRAQHERAQREGLEAEEIRRLNLEEGGDDAEDEAALTQLDTLIGQPLAGDEILEAIPICAPWAALARFKYKAKMQPGQQKKGKAVREILGKWARDASDNKKLDAQSRDTERIWPREAELIKAWREPEVIGVVPVKSVRVMLSGAGADTKGRGGKAGRGGRGSKRR